MDISKPGMLDAITQNLRKDFQSGIQSVKPIADMFVQKTPSTGDANVYAWLGHLPAFREWYANQPRVMRNVESFQYRVTNRKFEMTIPIPIDHVNDNQLSQYSMVSSNIGAAGALVPDQLIFEVINGGFSEVLTYDGLPLFSASHKVGLSTVNNLGTKVLSESNLETAIATIGGYTFKMDKLSTPTPLNPNARDLYLVVNPALKATAEKLCNLQRNTYGADNYLYGQAKVLSTAYITSTTAWFLVNVGGPIKPIILQEREKLQLLQKTPATDSTAFMYDEIIYSGRVRCAAAPTYPWLVYGSTGAST